MKSKQKHLTLSDRILIDKGLNEGKSFKAIASLIGKDPTTVSKEVKSIVRLSIIKIRPKSLIVATKRPV